VTEQPGFPVRVLLLDPGRLVPAMPADVQLHPCTDLADALGRAVAGAADVLVVSPRLAGLDATTVARLRACGCQVLAVTADPSDVALAARVGLTNCLSAPVDGYALLAALRDPDPQSASPASALPRTPVIAIWGPPGSPGRTAVTGLLSIGATRAGLRVAIVDADLAAPQWSLFVREPVAGSGLLVAARRLASGAPELSDLLVHLAPTVVGLTASAEPERWPEVSPLVIERLLPEVGAAVDAVLVDVGGDIRAAHPAYDIGWAHDAASVARSALAAADMVVAVMAADPVGVHRFASWWPLLKAQRNPSVVVANKLGVPLAGRRPERQVTAILDALGCDASRVDVKWDPSAAEELLGADWHAARRWGDAPGRLWSAVAEGLERIPMAAA
jgi:MinD-like ATPase involved in chromosome partitioning or flagellar assembly